MAIIEVNDTLSFACNNVLYADDLNDILQNIRNIINYINTNENDWKENNLDDSGNLQQISPSDPVEPVLRFKGLNPLNATLSDAEKRSDNPTGWIETSNVDLDEGLALYMIVGSKLGSTMLTYGNGFKWKGPFRIGSSNTTSTTGADDDKYNYIYCTTNVDISSYDGSNHNWENIPEHVEDKENYPSGVSDSITVSNDSSVSVTWTDHPCGVSENNKYEWQVGFTVSDDTYTYAFGPVCISHWGHNGMDGDGVEYIFYLVGETYNNNSGALVRNGEISSPETYFNNLTYGKYRDPSTGEMSSYVGVNYSNLESDTNYQKDDFIPMGWHDEPYDVTLECYLQYVSIRKKNWVLNEEESKWGPFSSPRKWNNYSAATASGLTITLTNDNIFVDDDTSSDGLEYASKNMILIWNGTTDVTKPGTTYGKVEVSIDLNSDSGSLRTNLIPCKISSLDSNDDSVVINDGDKLTWGVFYSLPTGNAFDTFKEKGFCLTAADLLNFNKNGTANEDDLKEGMTAAVTYTAKLYTNANDDNPVATVSRQLTLLVLNFSNGEAYSLIVSPNTIGISRPNSSSNYTIRNGENLIKISANEANGKLVLLKNLKISKPNGEKGLYIKVKKRISSGLESISTNTSETNYISLSGDDTNEITCTFNNFSFQQGVIKSFEVELWCVYTTAGDEIMVDTETIDFSIKGDDGVVENLELQISGLIDTMNLESYVITSINDNAVIDDQTITVDALRNGTENELTVKKGGSTSDGNLFKITNITLGSNSSLLDVYYYDSGYVLYTNNSGTNNDGWVSSNKFAILPKWDSINNRITTIEENIKLTTGNFYYDVLVKNNEGDVGTKRFNLNIFDISIDGSYYKLNILNDVLSYDSEKDLLETEYNPQIEIYTVDLKGESTPIILTNNIYKVKDSYSSTDVNKLFIDFGGLEEYVVDNNGLINIGNNKIEIRRQYSTGSVTESIEYLESGYDITLYKYIEIPNTSPSLYRLVWLDKEHIDCIKDGANGNDGYNSVIVRLYKRSDSIISSHGILDTTYYDFENKALYKTNSGGSLSNLVKGIKTNPSSDLNGWSSSVDNATISDGTENDNSSLLLYMTAATAMGNSSIDDISNTEWADPIPVSDDGSTPDYNIRTIYLYRYNETCPNKPNYNEISSNPYRIWYRFSNNKFYTDKDVLNSDTSGIQGTVNVDNNWYLSINTPTNQNLWETHATAVSLEGYDEIKSSEWSTPSIVSTKQEVTAGKTGKMFYMMGVWDSNKIYRIDDLKIPVVFYDDGEPNSSGNTGHYYYLNPKTEKKLLTSEDPSGISVGDIPGTKTFNTTTGERDTNKDTSTGHEYVWLKADDFGLIITEGIFSEFAKLGSAIMSGDWMYSSNGMFGNSSIDSVDEIINSRPVLANQDYDPNSTQNIVAYTMFDPKFVLGTELYEIGLDHTIATGVDENSDGDYDYYNIPYNLISDSRYTPITSDSIKLVKGVKYKFSIEWKVSLSDTLRAIAAGIVVGNEFNTYRFSLAGINSTSFTTSTLYTTPSETVEAKIGVMKRINSDLHIKSIKYGVAESYNPSWAVDLKTGTMIAAGGNFIVNYDGTVLAAGGKFLIDTNGNLIIDGNIDGGHTYLKHSRHIFEPDINISSNDTSCNTNLSITDDVSSVSYPPDIIIIRSKSVSDPPNLTWVSSFTSSVNDGILKDFTIQPENATELCFYPLNRDSSGYFTYNFNLMNPGNENCKDRSIDIYIGGIFETRGDIKVRAYITCTDVSDGFYKVFPDESGYMSCDSILIGDSDNESKTYMSNIKGTHLHLTSINMGAKYLWVGALT